MLSHEEKNDGEMDPSALNSNTIRIRIKRGAETLLFHTE
jgi:hypothetical protein